MLTRVLATQDEMWASSSLSRTDEAQIDVICDGTHHQ
jgi:hypothetical protein